METNPLEFSVRRRFSDFEWLQNTLLTLYPSHYITLLSKKNDGDRFSEEFLEKRMRALTKFMNHLLENPELRNSQILYSFLTLNEKNKFEEAKKKFGKLKEPQSYSDMSTISGKVSLSLTNDTDTYYANIKKNTSSYLHLIKNFKKNCKMLLELLGSLSQKLKDISNDFEEMHKNSEKCYENQDIINSYDILQKFMNDWSVIVKKQSVLFDINVKEYFKFSKKKYKAFNILINKTEGYKNTYLKASEKLNNKKDDLFKKRDFTHMDIPQNQIGDKDAFFADRNAAFKKMLPKETHNMELTKYNYVFYLDSLFKQFEKLKNIEAVKNKDMILYYTSESQELVNLFNDAHNYILKFFAQSAKNNSASHAE